MPCKWLDHRFKTDDGMVIQPISKKKYMRHTNALLMSYDHCHELFLTSSECASIDHNHKLASANCSQPVVCDDYLFLSVLIFTAIES